MMEKAPSSFSDHGSSTRTARGGGVSLPRSFWFGAALSVFLVSSWIAFRQQPHPDAYRQANPTQADWWRYPVEVNADRRLPRVWVDLNDVYALRETGHIWVVGNAGLILHSEDYGRHWTRRFLDRSPGSPDSGLPLTGGSGPGSPDSGLPLTEGSGPGSPDSGLPLTGSGRRGEDGGPPLTGSYPEITHQSSPNSTGISDSEEEPQLSLRSLANSDLRSVHFVDDQNGWIAGDNGALFSTSDGGGTWTRRDAGVGLETHHAIYFKNPSEGWVLGRYRNLLHTTNGGESWNQEKFSSYDLSGMDWSALAEFLGSEGQPAKDCNLRSYRYRFCAGGSTGPVVWLEAPAPRILGVEPTIEPSSDPVSVHLLDEGQARALTKDGELAEIVQGSRRWERKDLGHAVEPRSISFSDSERGWIAGARGTLLATEDGGREWWRATRSLPEERATLSEAPPHRLWPAPWYFLSLGLVGLLLAPALRSPKPEVISESVADLLVSDRPISAADRDVFDFKRVALGLSKFLRNEKTVPPLTIAVTGEWGTGKSSLMNLLQDDLRRYGFRPVWFNAWHHQKEEHLLASLLATVRVQAVPPWWRPEGAIFRFRLLRIRWARYWPLIAFLLVVFSFSLGYFRSHPGQLDAAWNSVKAIPSVVADPANWLRERGSKTSGPWIALLISGAGLVVSLWKGLKGFGVNPASLLARDSARTRVSDLEKLTGFRHQFAAEFRDITQALNPRTMVVMIDDLDRCKPEMVLEVLESVNFLISSGDCFVVLGMARERVIRCVGLSFKDVASELLVTQARPEEKDLPADELARKRRIEFAHQYLEKLINIEVPVPSPTHEQSKRLLRESAPQEELPESRRERIRRRIWSGTRKALPTAAAVVLLFLGYWVGATRMGQEKRDVQKPVQATTPAPQTGTGSPVTGTGEQTQTGSVVRSAPAEMDEAEEASPPVFVAVVLLVVLLGLGIWRLSVPPGVVIRDSQEFEDALETWHPLVFTFRNTPRSIKRFLNRVRYLAMLQRGQDEEPSRWRQVLAWLRGIFRHSEEEKEFHDMPGAIPEHALVALVAIEHSCPDWFEDDRFFRDPRTVPGGNSIPATIQEIVINTPLRAYRDAYLRMSRGIQVR